jgi:hypothetical protein
MSNVASGGLCESGNGKGGCEARMDMVDDAFAEIAKATAPSRQIIFNVTIVGII